MMTKDDLTALVARIMQADATESELDEWVTTLEANVPHPRVSDLIYHHDRDLSPEEVVSLAFDYEPFVERS
jgi:hypothetical protein